MNIWKPEKPSDEKALMNISTGAELKVLCCMMMSPAEVLSVDQMVGDADMIKYGYIVV